MNRQKREEALRNSSQSGKPSSDQPSRASEPGRDRVRGGDAESQERQQPQREPGKLPLPE